MALHVKWSSGDQIWYDGTQKILTVQDDDEGILIGYDGNGVDFKFYGNSTGAYLEFDESADLLNFNNIKVTYQAPATTVTTGSTGELALDVNSNRVQFVSHATGEVTEITLPPIANCAGIEFKIANTSSSGDVTVLTTGGSTAATIAISKAATLFCNGSDWAAIVGA